MTHPRTTPRPFRPGGRSPHERPSALFDRVCIGTVIALAVLWVVPIAWAVDTSLKPEAETTKLPVTWLIDQPTLEAYRSVLANTDLASWYLNSVLVATLVAAGTVLTASMAGFALSRVPFRGSGTWFWVILAGIMIPSQALVVPLYREVQSMGLLGTYWAVILPQIPTAVAVFVFKQFFDGLPRELIEAAQADGAGWLRIYGRIIMPLSRPAASAVAIFSFVWAWNNLLWPLLVLTDSQLMTVTVGLATVQSEFGIRYAQIMASAILGALPLLVLFLFFQRQIVRGIAGTGLK
ncbi:carbohydrate ABC transporter permease [Actinopolymorpha pittospori]